MLMLVLQGEACLKRGVALLQADLQATHLVLLSPLPADYDESPPQPGPDDPGARQLQLLECLAAEAPLEHPAFAGLGDGTELVADSFRLTFAEAAARGGCTWGWAGLGWAATWQAAGNCLRGMGWMMAWCCHAAALRRPPPLLLLPLLLQPASWM